MTVLNKYNDPYLILGGDFYRRNLLEAVREYPAIKQIVTGPTRGDATLDLLASNFNDNITDSGLLDSIFNLDNVKTDHKTVFVQHRMPHVPSYEIEHYSYYHLDQAGDSNFGNWLLR